VAAAAIIENLEAALEPFRTVAALSQEVATGSDA
jgi:hypothetical protein